ncbi:BON domain-containing protein [Gemmatimonas groenlandica]|uniref:BON domain-containing protein n=1 Tax=Gemmatimonas groenlandica TaxID=2732249 RepID=A0A6M4IMP7_9BACT|nr:BON domain-containing protein [Gemmatimonas groenlandica]QJR34292.1 BON domain-containing protein [Gemmatimonas groenlandica]
MTRITQLLLATTVVFATACGNTADGAKEDTKNAAEATSEAASSAGAAMDAAGETADVKSALMADATVDAGDINVDTNKDTKTVTLNGSVKSEAQKARAEVVAKTKAPEYTVVNNLVVK